MEPEIWTKMLRNLSEKKKEQNSLLMATVWQKLPFLMMFFWNGKQTQWAVEGQSLQQNDRKRKKRNGKKKFKKTSSIKM